MDHLERAVQKCLRNRPVAVTPAHEAAPDRIWAILPKSEVTRPGARTCSKRNHPPVQGNARQLLKRAAGGPSLYRRRKPRRSRMNRLEREGNSALASDDTCLAPKVDRGWGRRRIIGSEGSTRTRSSTDSDIMARLPDPSQRQFTSSTRPLACARSAHGGQTGHACAVRRTRGQDRRPRQTSALTPPLLKPTARLGGVGDAALGVPPAHIRGTVPLRDRENHARRPYGPGTALQEAKVAHRLLRRSVTRLPMSLPASAGQ